MTPLVPLMLFGWIPFTVILFFTLKPHHAVLCSVIGGCLFLPMRGYDLPGLPEYTKSTAIAIGLIMGGRLSGHRRAASFRWRLYDFPMILWCLCPIATSLSNNLGFYDGLSTSFSQVVVWGVPYLAGRVYFDSAEKLRDLCLGIIVGGLLYLPLCLYEIRMSPQLSINFYGFFPHSFGQMKRYGGFRPIVFMQHGLMVSLWMAVTTTVAFWLWRSRDVLHLKGIPMGFLVATLMITTVLCKSVNGWFALAVGCGCYLFSRRGKARLPLILLLLAIPLYIGLRMTGVVAGHEVESVAAHVVDAERAGSLAYRLEEEDLFSRRAFERPILGWGGYGRNRIDPVTGKKIRKAIDALWLIEFGAKGFLGLLSLFVGMLSGPWLVLRNMSNKSKYAHFIGPVPVVLSLVVILFMIDSLLNGMINPVYIVCSGALVSFSVAVRANQENHQPSAVG